MSHPITDQWAWAQTVGHPTRKAVLVAIAKYVKQPGGWAFPGYEQLARMCECDRRTAIRHVKALEEGGFLEVKKRRSKLGKQTSNEYRLRLENDQSQSDAGVTLAGGVTDVTLTNPRVTDERSQSDTGDRSRVTPMTPELQGESQEDIRRSRPTVDGIEVTDTEWESARQIVAAFNVEAGTHWSAEAFLSPIVVCLRLHPELSTNDHLGILVAVFRAPFWTDTPSPKVVYSKPEQFERCLHVWRRPRASVPSGATNYDENIEVLA